MSASHMYTWLLTMPAGGVLVVAVLRCLTLSIGFKMTLKRAPKADLLPLYREFAHALSARGHREEGDPSSRQWMTEADRDRLTEDSGRIRRSQNDI